MLCTICQVNEVKGEGQDFCVVCHFTGRRFESFLLDDDRSNVLGRIREIPNVSSATVWHLGMGAFQLGVMLDDGRLIAPGVAIEDSGEVMLAPSIPRSIDKWAVAVTDEEQSNVAVLEGAYDDDELVEVVAKIAVGEIQPSFRPGPFGNGNGNGSSPF